jgi:hypothetical protein
VENNVDIATALEEAMAAALPEQPDTVESAAEQSTEGTATSVTETVESESEQKEPEAELPEGYVAVPVVDGELATQFKLLDEQGELEVPNLIVEYKANGQVRKDRLDQVVKLAQWGVYNEEREQKTKALEKEYSEVQTQAQQVIALLEQREKQIERLLQDEDFFYSVQEAFRQETTPERKAARAEEELQSYKVQKEMEEIHEQGMAFWSGEVEPALKMIHQALPSVTMEELEERMFYAMQAHADTAPNGSMYVPASRHEMVRKYVLEDLSVWAQVQNARRFAGTAKAAPQSTAEQIAAQKAKRQVGQATRPVGGVGTVSAPPKNNRPATIDEALDSAMAAVLSNIR